MNPVLRGKGFRLVSVDCAMRNTCGILRARRSLTAWDTSSSYSCLSCGCSINARCQWECYKTFDESVHLSYRAAKASSSSRVALYTITRVYESTSQHDAYWTTEEYGRLRELVRQCHEHTPKPSK